MKKIIIAFIIPLLIGTFAFAYSDITFTNENEPAGLFLTWKDDPYTTMVIDYHTKPGYQGSSALQYRVKGAKKWIPASGSNFPYPHHDRTIHRIALNKLKAGKTYEFTLDGFTRIYSFKTLPKGKKKPVRFAIGGDTMHQKAWMDSTNRAAMVYDPDFIVWGGDLAYANGSPDNIGRWDDWFQSIMETLIHPDGRVVPILVGIGNHEVQRKPEDYVANDANRLRYAPFYYSLFAFPGQPGYGVIDFGRYMSFVFLDTDHTNPIDGVQTEWLKETLEARSKTLHIIPVYHVPGYPSNRSYDGGTQTRVREHFVPLFEAHRVKMAFENHDHTYKRTHPLKEGKVVGNGEGIVYLGDGSWGVKPRNTNEAWYLARRESLHQCIIVTIEGKSIDMKMVSKEGEVFDSYKIDL
ncbi:MAG: metallophosphoesterase family protein [Cyclobacteriaceae bacterium]|nr:metallophosphoesterase family protein [Cyclobacteriaceae bacterium]